MNGDVLLFFSRQRCCPTIGSVMEPDAKAEKETSTWRIGKMTESEFWGR